MTKYTFVCNRLPVGRQPAQFVALLLPLPSCMYRRRDAPIDDAPTEEFLAMTFVHGPEGVTFSSEKPAKLRFCLGCVDDLAPAEGGANQVNFFCSANLILKRGLCLAACEMKAASSNQPFDYVANCNNQTHTTRSRTRCALL